MASNKRVNPFTEALGNIADDFRLLKSNAPKKPLPDLGKEELTAHQFKERIGRMSQTERQALLQEPGMRDQILDMFKD